MRNVMSCLRVTDEDEEEDAQPSVVTSKHVSLQLVVPGHAVGAVIGQQGAQIKQVPLQRESRKLPALSRGQINRISPTPALTMTFNSLRAVVMTF